MKKRLSLVALAVSLLVACQQDHDARSWIDYKGNDETYEGVTQYLTELSNKVCELETLTDSLRGGAPRSQRDSWCVEVGRLDAGGKKPPKFPPPKSE